MWIRLSCHHVTKIRNGLCSGISRRQGPFGRKDVIVAHYQDHMWIKTGLLSPQLDQTGKADFSHHQDNTWFRLEAHLRPHVNMAELLSLLFTGCAKWFLLTLLAHHFLHSPCLTSLPFKYVCILRSETSSPVRARLALPWLVFKGDGVFPERHIFLG